MTTATTSTGSEGTAPEPLSYTVDQAAAVTGISAAIIRRHIDAGTLIARYPSTRAVITRDELHAWLHNLPKDPTE
jgi:excisionase family DNA binding protein